MPRLGLCLVLAVLAVAGGVSSPQAASGAATTGGANLLESGGSSGSAGAGAGSSAAGGEERAGASKRTGRTTEGNEESGGVGFLPIAFGMGGAGLLIATIAFFILRDARRSAPVPEGAYDGAAPMRQVQTRKRRSKAKAAKHARKRNR